MKTFTILIVEDDRQEAAVEQILSSVLKWVKKKFPKTRPLIVDSVDGGGAETWIRGFYPKLDALIVESADKIQEVISREGLMDDRAILLLEDSVQGVIDVFNRTGRQGIKFDCAILDMAIKLDNSSQVGEYTDIPRGIDVVDHLCSYKLQESRMLVVTNHPKGVEEQLRMEFRDRTEEVKIDDIKIVSKDVYPEDLKREIWNFLNRVISSE